MTMYDYGDGYVLHGEGDLIIRRDVRLYILPLDRRSDLSDSVAERVADPIPFVVEASRFESPSESILRGWHHGRHRIPHVVVEKKLSSDQSASLQQLSPSKRGIAGEDRGHDC